MSYVKDYELEFLDFSQNSLLMSSYKSCVVSLGVTLRMMVKRNSNSNVTIEIIFSNFFNSLYKLQKLAETNIYCLGFMATATAGSFGTSTCCSRVMFLFLLFMFWNRQIQTAFITTGFRFLYFLDFYSMFSLHFDFFGLLLKVLMITVETVCSSRHNLRFTFR